MCEVKWCLCRSVCPPLILGGRQVVELGCGTGALTRVLHKRYPHMLAVDVDPRAITFIQDKMPTLTAIQSDVLQVLNPSPHSPPSRAGLVSIHDGTMMS